MCSAGIWTQVDGNRRTASDQMVARNVRNLGSPRVPSERDIMARRNLTVCGCPDLSEP